MHTDRRLARISDALQSGYYTVQPLSNPCEVSQIEACFLALERALKVPLPTDYSQFITATKGRALFDSVSGIYFFALSSISDAVAANLKVVATDPSGRAIGLIVGEHQSGRVLVLSLANHSTSSPLALVPSPSGYASTLPQPLSSSTSSDLLGQALGHLSPALDIVEHSWSDDPLWSRVGWGL